MNANTQQKLLGGRKAKFSFSAVNTQAMLIVAIILLSISFTILSPVFLKLQNFINIGIYASTMAVMAAGLTLAMLLGGLDISQYAVAAMCGMLCGILVKAGMSPFLIIPIVLFAGIIMGVINAFVITTMKINPIIATLGTQLVFRAIAFISMDGKYIQIDNKVFNYIGRGYLLGLPITIWVMLFVYIIIFYVLKYTTFGRRLFAVGGNPTASFLSGINVNRVRFIAFVISSLTAAIAGILLAAQVGAAMPTAGQGSELDVIVAVVLGGISLSGGKGKISGTILGVIILCLLNNGMTLLSVQGFYQMLIRGLVLIFAVFLDSLRGGGYK